MGFETIKNQIDRENWLKVIDKLHMELKKKGITHIEFSEFKYDGSYGKAKTGLPATKWVLAQSSSNTWVELELKPRKIKGLTCMQHELYQHIKTSYESSMNQLINITWDEKDRTAGYRDRGGNDIRIKVYLNNKYSSLSKNDIWIETMIDFIKVFDPILQSRK